MEHVSPNPYPFNGQNGDILDDLVEEQSELHTLSFYDGFKATQQYLPALLKHHLVPTIEDNKSSHSQSPQDHSYVIRKSKSSSGISSLFGCSSVEESAQSSSELAKFENDPLLQKATRHYTTSIKNISLLFSDLLAERTTLLGQQRMVHQTQVHMLDVISCEDYFIDITPTP